MRQYNSAQTRGTGKRSGGALKIALVVTLMLGLFLQISQLARVSAQSKEISRVDRQIRELTSAREDLQVCLSMYQNLDRIENLAFNLGMQFPEEDQIRVVSLPGYSDESSAQTAENTAAETSMR